MNRQEAKSLLPIIETFSKGKTIEVRTNPKSITNPAIPNDWESIDDVFAYLPNTEYRIKPEPKYRPFKNAEECWNEMQKHQPFGMVKQKKGCKAEMPIVIACGKCYIKYGIIKHSFEFVKKYYTFADGTPFGKLEEEK